MRLVHELKELINYRLKEFPVSLKEARILSDDIHDVTGDDSFVILAPLHLSEAKKILDDRDKESLLCLFIHGEGDGADGPAKHVAVVP
jgi:hypothetical protein